MEIYKNKTHWATIYMATFMFLAAVNVLIRGLINNFL